MPAWPVEGRKEKMSVDINTKKVNKTFSLKPSTLMLLRKLEHVKSVNLSAFADKILKSAAEAALAEGYGNIGENSKNENC